MIALMLKRSIKQCFVGGAVNTNSFKSMARPELAVLCRVERKYFARAWILW
jgi:hypothetical protein